MPRLLPLMRRAIVLDDDMGLVSSRFYQLNLLEGAEQLPADAVAALMEQALQAPHSNLYVLCHQEAAEQISPAQLASIVEAAAAMGDDGNLQLLAALPAFNQLQPAAVDAALQAAVGAGSMSSLAVLLNSPLAAAADDLLVPAMVLAVRSDAWNTLRMLIEALG